MENPLRRPSLHDFINPAYFEKIKAFAAEKQTPFLILDPQKIGAKYDELQKNLPYAKIYYAVKANPNDTVVKTLADRGSYFDTASIYEIDQMFRLGISADRLSYGNPIKKEEHIAYAYKKGIRLFVTDSECDLQKLSRSAPGSRVFFRILVDGSKSADWPLSRKFGSTPAMTIRLIHQAKQLGLIPYGISFHVGSQQRDTSVWEHAIGEVKKIFDAVEKDGIKLRMINLGGGFPATYLSPTKHVMTYSEVITNCLRHHFGDSFPEIITEPGRSIAGDCGILVSELVLVSEKSVEKECRWAFLDIGKFGGLIESLDEAIKYPIFVAPRPDHTSPEKFILAGPTCDSMDILYEKFQYQFPSNIQSGERIYILTAGAYTSSYSAVYFNGFPPLKEYVL